MTLVQRLRAVGDPSELALRQQNNLHQATFLNQWPTSTEPKYNISMSENATLTAWNVSNHIHLPSSNKVYVRPIYNMCCTGMGFLTLSTRTSAKEQQRPRRRRSCSWSHGARTAQRSRRRCSTPPPLTPWKSAWSECRSIYRWDNWERCKLK